MPKFDAVFWALLDPFREPFLGPTGTRAKLSECWPNMLVDTLVGMFLKQLVHSWGSNTAPRRVLAQIGRDSKNPITLLFETMGGGKAPRENGTRRSARVSLAIVMGSTWKLDFSWAVAHTELPCLPNCPTPPHRHPSSTGSFDRKPLKP